MVDDNHANIVLEVMQNVESRMDGLTWGRVISREQRDKFEKVWIEVRANYLSHTDGGNDDLVEKYNNDNKQF